MQENNDRGVKREATAQEVMGLDPNIQIAIQQTPITFTAASQEMLMEFGFIKDKDGFLRGVTSTQEDQNSLAR